MKVGSKRIIALSGSALMVAGMAVTGAGAASATDRGDRDRRDRDRPSCSLELDRDRRGNLEIELKSDVRGATRAYGVADFNRGRDIRGFVDLDRRGNASVELDVPRLASSVQVTVWIRGDRLRLVKCEATLDLRDRRRGGGDGPRTIWR